MRTVITPQYMLHPMGLIFHLRNGITSQCVHPVANFTLAIAKSRQLSTFCDGIWRLCPRLMVIDGISLKGISVVIPLCLQRPFDPLYI